MTNRRRFLQLAALGGTGVLLNRCIVIDGQDQITPANDQKTTSGEGHKPLVLSTWRHGVAANAKAWEVLSNGGTALDAVEQGVRVSESDFTNRSVGLGGLPDRNGHVTLDACIMDHQSRCGAFF
ncbi:MAG: hypothetical protein EA392_14510 [Cryomorphaceae bacterium]|nr:MAG: hypothetical protein EA392_14510 [Cryomorphaceae bacterium]